MASMLGVVVPIPGLTMPLLETFFDHWVNLHDLEALRKPTEPKLLDPGDVTFQELVEWREKREACAAALIETVQPQEFASLEALYYFDREHPYSQAFEAALEDSLRNATGYPDAQRFKQAILNLLVMTRALENVLNSLDFLGQAASREVLLARYGLSSAHERLLERSARRKRRVNVTSP